MQNIKVHPYQRKCFLDGSSISLQFLFYFFLQACVFVKRYRPCFLIWTRIFQICIWIFKILKLSLILKILQWIRKDFAFNFISFIFFSRHQLSFNKKRNHFIRNKKKCKEIFRHRKTCYYCCLTAKVCIIYYVSLKIPSNSNRAKVFSKK